MSSLFPSNCSEANNPMQFDTPMKQTNLFFALNCQFRGGSEMNCRPKQIWTGGLDRSSCHSSARQ